MSQRRPHKPFKLAAKKVSSDSLDHIADGIGDKYSVRDNSAIMEEIRYGLYALNDVIFDFLHTVDRIESQSDARISDRGSTPPRIFFETLERAKTKHAHEPDTMQLLGMLDDIEDRKVSVTGDIIARLTSCVHDGLVDDLPANRGAFKICGSIVRQAIDLSKVRYQAEVNFSKGGAIKAAKQAGIEPPIAQKAAG